MDISKAKKMFGMYKKQKEKQKKEMEEMFKNQLEKNNIVVEEIVKKQLEIHRKEIGTMYEKYKKELDQNMANT